MAGADERTTMQLGMVGLGRMGGNMAERLRDGGHDVIGYDAFADTTQVATLEELVNKLDESRTIWLMVPSGEPTNQTIAALADLCRPGDVIVDGGNSYFRDSITHAAMLAERGIVFVDAGVSGGVWGRDNGYCLMVGGPAEAVERIKPALETLAPPGGLVHTGPAGSGHFVKMIHNGIEYGMMQAIGEGFEIMSASPDYPDIDLHAVAEAWRYGSVVRSWLLDLAAAAMQSDPRLENIRGFVQDSGEGRWTILEAINQTVPAPVISAALFARFASRQDDSFAMKIIAALRREFGGHAVKEL
ncbi:MAG TPA: decarboxylating 6-phosphogluconate dehydrogenase [Actinomycetota bacterium]|nr:decarboxylating 6-phosphogluconate dehydrogenase [Actinomycetota bacterium]